MRVRLRVLHRWGTVTVSGNPTPVAVKADAPTSAQAKPKRNSRTLIMLAVPLLLAALQFVQVAKLRGKQSETQFVGRGGQGFGAGRALDTRLLAITIVIFVTLPLPFANRLLQVFT